MGYRLEGKAKPRTNDQADELNSRFARLISAAKACLGRGQPVIALDVKAPLGTSRPKGPPDEVRLHEFVQRYGKAGSPEMSALSWIPTTSDADAARLATAGIRRWWYSTGQSAYPDAAELLIVTECGREAWHSQSWDVTVQELASESGLRIEICNLPPATSKWKKIEPQQFSFLIESRQGIPRLLSEVIVSVIGAGGTEADSRRT